MMMDRGGLFPDVWGSFGDHWVVSSGFLTVTVTWNELYHRKRNALGFPRFFPRCAVVVI